MSMINNDDSDASVRTLMYLYFDCVCLCCHVYDGSVLWLAAEALEHKISFRLIMCVIL